MKTESSAEPFLKWAGGKRRLLPELLKRIPDQDAVDVYYEPFLGGGALFFATDFRKAVLGDINEELINAYRAVRDSVEELIEVLNEHIHDRDYYYKIRSIDPAGLSPVERAGRTVFLNRTCFNGLYRVNSRGLFNVPFGAYKNPVICNERNLRAASRKLKKAELICGDFRKVAKQAGCGDFVYFDPPYARMQGARSFVDYSAAGFGPDDQERLAHFFRELCWRGARCLLSNADALSVQKLYAGFARDSVLAPRSINSDGGNRGCVSELLISNYAERS